MSGPLCAYNNALGIPGEGIHAARMPGTDTAAVDYIMTLLAAWMLSAAFKWSLVNTTIALFLCSIVAHWLFCVQVGTVAR